MTTTWPTFPGTIPPFADHPDRACANTDTDVFFPDGGGDNGAEAKAICADCPLKQLCADWAAQQPRLKGIWGGFSERDRERLRGSRPTPPANVGRPPAERRPVSPARLAAVKKAMDAKSAATLATVAAHAAAGRSVPDIATQSGLSRRTVFRYLAKLGKAA